MKFIFGIVIGILFSILFSIISKDIANKTNKKFDNSHHPVEEYAHTTAAEQVNHPAHYKKNGKECIDLMREEYGDDAVYNFCICNAFKYKFRAGYKAGNSMEQDLAKANWYKNYADRLMEGTI